MRHLKLYVFSFCTRTRNHSIVSQICTQSISINHAFNHIKIKWMSFHHRWMNFRHISIMVGRLKVVSQYFPRIACQLFLCRHSKNRSDARLMHSPFRIWFLRGINRIFHGFLLNGLSQNGHTPQSISTKQYQQLKFEMNHFCLSDYLFVCR